MGQYRKVDVGIWEGDLAAQINGDAELWCICTYLLTNRQNRMGLGLYRLPLVYISEATGLALETCRRCVVDALPTRFARYDDASKTVFIVEQARHEWGEAPNGDRNDVKGMVKVLLDTVADLRKSPLVQDFYDRYGDGWASVLPTRPEAVADALETRPESVNDASASAESLSRKFPQEQDPDPEQEQDPESPDTSTGLDEGARPKVSKAAREFAEFWRELPPQAKKGKAEALKKWQRIPAPEREISAAVAWVKAAKASDDWTKDGGDYIQHGVTIVSQRRWLDGVESFTPPRQRKTPGETPDIVTPYHKPVSRQLKPPPPGWDLTAEDEAELDHRGAPS